MPIAGRLGIWCVTGWLALTVPLAQAESEILPQLNVQGSAEIEIPADQLQFRVGVKTQDKTADQALDSNSKKMAKIVAALKSQGLTDDEFQTGQFSLSPQWSPRPKNPPEDWASTIVGYHASNELVIKTGQFDKVGEWIALATEKGANHSGQIQFSLKDPDAYRNQAIHQATERAKSYAEAAAMAAGVELVRVINLSVNNAYQPPVVYRKAARAEMMTDAVGSVAAPVIDAGNITVNASVNINYEIR